MEIFHTRSSARKNIITVIITFFFMFALAFLGLKIAVVTWLFFEGILLITFLVCLLLTGRTHWEIDFKENHLLLSNTGNGKQFHFENLTRADLIITQNAKQQTRNTCDLKICDTPFAIYDVQNCKELSAYILAHFQ